MMFNANVLLLIAAFLVNYVAAAPAPPHYDPLHKKNIIMVIPDGFGQTGMTLARQAKQNELNISDNEFILNMDPDVIGNIRTKSESSLITDSAAAGTAFSTGYKTVNGYIGMDKDKNYKGTILEALKLQGYKTGLVVTSTMTHATPAAYAAHVDDRDSQDIIAEHMIAYGDFNPFGQVVDYLSGGGKCWWTPQDQDESCREDDKDLIAAAKEKGFNYFETREEFDNFVQNGSLSLPALSFWANDGHIDYEIDRDPKKTPSLSEQAKLAVDTLSKATKDSEQGFFLMVEGSRIDHAAHDNDPATYYREIVALDDAYGVLKTFAQQSEVETIVVVAADHETGGVTLGYEDQPSWYPDLLLDVNASFEIFEDKVTELNSTDADNSTITKFTNDWIAEHMKINNATETQLAAVLEAVRADTSIKLALSPIISERAAVGWTTGGHTNADITSVAYANSPLLTNYFNRAEQGSGLKGSQDNTNLNAFLAEISGADLQAASDKLAEFQ